MLTNLITIYRRDEGRNPILKYKIQGLKIFQPKVYTSKKIKLPFKPFCLLVN